MYVHKALSETLTSSTTGGTPEKNKEEQVPFARVAITP